MFKVLERYGARITIYSEMGTNLILTALAKRNFSLFENLLGVGITKNTIDCPNALPILSRFLVDIFLKEQSLNITYSKNIL